MAVKEGWLLFWSEECFEFVDEGKLGVGMVFLRIKYIKFLEIILYEVKVFLFLVRVFLLFNVIVNRVLELLRKMDKDGKSYLLLLFLVIYSEYK